MREMTAEEKKEYRMLTEGAEQMELDLTQLSNEPVIYGYARVSTKGQARDGNSLEAQTKELLSNGASEVISDAYTGSVMDRPELDRLLKRLKKGDTLMVTKLDRIARSLTQGIELINGLIERGIRVHVLNMGVMDNSPTGQLIRNVMLAFAEFERNMIMQRTREGKQIARTKEGYREGRPKKYGRQQMDHAMQLLQDHSYSQVSEMTGISTATLAREKARRQK
jgi:DNA invertase Pin-like site-specific DNA recombinase